MAVSQITCKIEELPFISELVRGNFSRNAERFAAFSTVFSGDFPDRYKASQDEIESIISPVELTGEIKNLTRALQAGYKQARTYLNRLEFLIKSASGALTIADEDFPVKAVRDQISRKNDEGIVQGMKDLMHLIRENQSVLEETGLTPEYIQEIDDFIGTFKQNSLGQTRKVQERMHHVSDKTDVINAHWDMITQVCEAGKSNGKADDDENMVKEFTMTELIKKVRQQRKEEEEGEDARAEEIEDTEAA